MRSHRGVSVLGWGVSWGALLLSGCASGPDGPAAAVSPPAGGDAAPFVVRFYSETSEPSARPSAKICAQGKLIGGGVAAEPLEAPVYLTASFPDEDGQCWVGEGTTNSPESRSQLRVWAVVLEDPDDELEVLVARSETSGSSRHPEATAVLPEGYALTGGGGLIDYGSGVANMLYASFPLSAGSWTVRGTDHLYPAPATATAYALGVRFKNGRPLESGIWWNETPAALDPHQWVHVPVGFDQGVFVGGGAEVVWSPPESLSNRASLLTATAPSDPPSQDWYGRAFWSFKYSENALMVYGIGLFWDWDTGPPGAR